MNVRFGALVCGILLTAPVARGDGGTVRASERCGPYRVTVFTSPTPLRAGSADVSVLVQDDDSREVIADAAVTVRAVPQGRPRDQVSAAATPEAATNKLLRAAVFDLPAAGTWDVAVAVGGPRGDGVVRFAVEVDEPPPAWADLIGWVGWPALVVAGYAAHRTLVRRKRRA